MRPYNDAALVRRRLLGCVNRLRRLIDKNDLDAPDTIVANEIAMILRYALAIFPADMGKALGQYLADPTRAWMGLCCTCAGHNPDRDEGDCPACRAEAEAKYGHLVDDADTNTPEEPDHD